VVLTLLTLKVKVEMAMGTLIAFHPKNLHGTTCVCSAHTCAATICFASRIKAAFEKAQQGLSVDLHAGAGEGAE
jgi:predicted 2-oxoglutarate/Fe(II)-dependent dioxygenase YbiX